MERLKVLIAQYGRWQPLGDYLQRIELYCSPDISICVEKCKALLDSIAREICNERERSFTNDDNLSKLLKFEFGSLGYGASDQLCQISGCLANVGQRISDVRNLIATTSHGRTMIELEQRNSTIGCVAAEFLVHSTELVACLLIELFEMEFPRTRQPEPLQYDHNKEFNQFLDDLYGEFQIAEYSYSASKILFGVDPQAYGTELKSFERDIVNDNKGE